jgi:transcriptional regulator with XRE-family HTH domain
MSPQRSPNSWAVSLTRSIGGEILRHRKARQWSAQRLADECTRLGLETPRDVITDLEIGRRANISVAELLVIAAALGVPPALLVFAVGSAQETEMLPGKVRTPFRALQWLSGEGPRPGPDDAGVVTPGVLNETGPVEPVALYRQADQIFEQEAQMLARARAMERSAAAADDEERRAEFAFSAKQYHQDARYLQEARERIRRHAQAGGFLPPERDMTLRPPGDALIV